VNASLLQFINVCKFNFNDESLKIETTGEGEVPFQAVDRPSPLIGVGCFCKPSFFAIILATFQMYHLRKPFANQSSICPYIQPAQTVKKAYHKADHCSEGKILSLKFCGGVWLSSLLDT